MQVGVGVGALSLVGGAAVIVPDGKVLHTVRLLLQTLGLTTDALPSPIDPDVVSLNSEQKLISPRRIESVVFTFLSDPTSGTCLKQSYLFEHYRSFCWLKL